MYSILNTKLIIYLMKKKFLLKYGIKLFDKNIEFNGKFYKVSHFLTFLLKRYLKEKN